jgi:ferrous iron transport protein A
MIINRIIRVWIGMCVRLDELPLDQPAMITGIDWASLGEAPALRLRALGFETGVAVEALHKGVLWSRDPLAVRVGRMTIALRRVQAAAIEVAAI